MKTVRIIYFSIAALSASFASYLAFEVDSKHYEIESAWERHGAGASVSIDSAKDGAAGGFAILSGLALVAASITYLKKD